MKKLNVQKHGKIAHGNVKIVIGKGEWITNDSVERSPSEWTTKQWIKARKKIESAVIYTLIVGACEHILLSCHAEMHTPAYFQMKMFSLAISKYSSSCINHLFIQLILYFRCLCVCIHYSPLTQNANNLWNLMSTSFHEKSLSFPFIQHFYHF